MLPLAGGLDAQDPWLVDALIALRQEAEAVQALLRAERLDEMRRKRG